MPPAPKRDKPIEAPADQTETPVASDDARIAMLERGQAEMMKTLHGMQQGVSGALTQVLDRVDGLAKQVADQPAQAVQEGDGSEVVEQEVVIPGVVELPEGWVRFWSVASEYQIPANSGQYVTNAGGKTVLVGVKMVDFKNHIYDTDDKEVIAFLRKQQSHPRMPGYGDFFENPDAVADSGVTVAEGVKSAGRPGAPLPKPPASPAGAVRA